MRRLQAKHSFFIFFLLCFFVLVPTSLRAVELSDLQPSLEIQLVPEFPAPQSSVLIQAQNILNKEAALYTWTVDGRVVDQGVGRDRITITAGAVGVRTTVSVSVSFQGVPLGSRSRTILPGELDLVWEGDTYVPPFYSGKTQSTGDSLITVLAVPNMIVNGSRLSAQNLVYRWYINDSQTPLKSGFGLSSISLTPPLFNSAFTVRAVASTQDGTVAVQKIITIAPQAPEIVLYEKHPLLGVLFNKTLNTSVRFLGEEITLRLFPLFVVNPAQTSLSWEIDGNTVDADSSGRELTLRKTGSGQGSFSLEATLETAGSLYERARLRGRIIF